MATLDPATKRRLGKLVAQPAGAEPVLADLLASLSATPLDAAKALAFLLAWAGRVVLGPSIVGPAGAHD